jgi:Flp pilus assembly CpaF family ATPase
MNIWYNNLIDNSRNVAKLSIDDVRIGRAGHNHLVLSSPFIADDAIRLRRRNGVWELMSLGINGCEVEGEEVYGGQTRTLSGGEQIKLYPFTLTLELDGQGIPQAELRQQLDRRMSELMLAIHAELLARINLDSDLAGSRETDKQYLYIVERNIEEIARENGIFETQQSALLTHIAGHCVRSALLGRLIDTAKETQHNSFLAERAWAHLVTDVPEREAELRMVVDHVLESLGQRGGGKLSEQTSRVDVGFWPLWDRIGDELQDEFAEYLVSSYLKRQIKDIIFGYGPLDELLRLPTITEIMVVDRDRIYVEKDGVVENSGRRFISDAVTLSIIERIVATVGRRIDKSSPLVDARLPDGSRVNAIIPPLAVSGPCLTIRRFPSKRLLIEDLVARGSVSRTVAEFLRAAVVTRKNIIVSGGTGTGKTTLLNCLSDFIPDQERIVTVEDTAELRLSKQHVVRLETKQANIEGAGEYTIRELVRNALRMRPDRIVVGECRGAEALDMLQAMNTGHDGSLTTIHANSASDVIQRLEVLVQMAADLPVHSIHRQITSAINLIVQLSRLADGRRCICQVTEVAGYDEANATIVTKDLFLREEGPAGGQLQATGSLPTFMSDLLEHNLLDLTIFYQ